VDINGLNRNTIRNNPQQGHNILVRQAIPFEEIRNARVRMNFKNASGSPSQKPFQQMDQILHYTRAPILTEGMAAARGWLTSQLPLSTSWRSFGTSGVMKPLTKAASIASIVGFLFFAVVFLMGYLHLLSHQPPHEPGKPWPPEVTSFPPTSAWVLALPCGVGVFVVVFFVTLILFSSRHHETEAN
jgi:hypothetical protein